MQQSYEMIKSLDETNTSWRDEKKNDTNNNNKNTKLQSNKEMGSEYMLY